MKRWLSAILVFLLFTLFPASVMASEWNKKVKMRTDEDAIEYIEQYANDIKDSNEVYSVRCSRQLNSFSKEKSYILYQLSPRGYAIYDEYSGIVEEMLLDSDCPYDRMKEGVLYYGGPMNYIVRSGDQYRLIEEETILSDAEIARLSEADKATSNRRNALKATPITTEYYYMNSATYFTHELGDKFGSNVAGTCTQIACAVMLGYYDFYVNEQYVPTAYEDSPGTSEAFHTLLKTFLGSSSCSIPNAASGLNAYFDSIFFSEPTAYACTGNHETVFSLVSNRVYANRPTVIAMFNSYNSECPWNHSVVAYGYRVEVTGAVITSAAYFVHTGWHSSNLAVYAWDWFADALYIA